MPQIRKKTSNRQTLKHKYRVLKKTKEHRRKLRKMAKLNPQVKKLKKDPGIPNLWPFKEQMIEKIVQEKEQDEKVRAEQKAKRKKVFDQKRQLEATEKKKHAEEKPGGPSRAAQKKSFFREMNNLIEKSDVILEVLDARDPMGCRCQEIEEQIVKKMQAHGSNPKQVVLVLNKIDLVPGHVVKEWLEYLRQFHPTVAFKSATGKGQDSKLGQQHMKAEDATPDQLARSTSVGADNLKQLLKKYALYGGSMGKKKKRITVGVIGYPNVGKGSLINSLLRKQTVGVSPVAGFTTKPQEVNLDSDIVLIDSPGVLFATDAPEEELVLRNCIKPESIEDPEHCAQRIVQMCPKPQLLQIFEVPNFETPTDFVRFVAEKYCGLQRGGKVNLEAGARRIIKMWNSGKIPYYSRPPEGWKNNKSASDQESLNTLTLVKEFSKEFDIEAFLKEADKQTDQEMEVIDKAQNSGKGKNFMHKPASKPIKIVLREEDDDSLDTEGDSGESKSGGMQDDSSSASQQQQQGRPGKSQPFQFAEGQGSNSNSNKGGFSVGESMHSGGDSNMGDDDDTTSQSGRQGRTETKSKSKAPTQFIPEDEQRNRNLRKQQKSEGSRAKKMERRFSRAFDGMGQMGVSSNNSNETDMDSSSGMSNGNNANGNNSNGNRLTGLNNFGFPGFNPTEDFGGRQDHDGTGMQDNDDIMEASSSSSKPKKGGKKGSSKGKTKSSRSGSTKSSSGGSKSGKKGKGSKKGGDSNAMSDNYDFSEGWN